MSKTKIQSLLPNRRIAIELIYVPLIESKIIIVLFGHDHRYYCEMRLQTQAVPIAFSPFLPIMQMCLGNDSSPAASGQHNGCIVKQLRHLGRQPFILRGNVAGAPLGTDILLPAVSDLTLVISVVGRLSLGPRIPSTTGRLPLMSTSVKSNEGGHSVVSVCSGGKSDHCKRQSRDPESRYQHLRTVESRPSFSRYMISNRFPKHFIALLCPTPLCETLRGTCLSPGQTYFRPA